MYTYFCYGLHVQSELEIPELLSSSRENIDVTIRYGSQHEVEIDHDPDDAYALKRTSDEIALWIPRAGGLRVRKGREMTVFPAKHSETEGFRFLVAGVGMGLILCQREVSSLHGSAVSIDGKAVAFVGRKGMGKSTTASIFHKEGHPVITDDVLPFQVRSDSVQVIPSFPHLKLFPSTIEVVLAEDPDTHPQVDPANKKRARTVKENFPTHPLPLRCIYVLDWKDPDSEIVSSRLAGREACLELLRHSFALRMFKSKGATEEQLGKMSRLAAQVPVRRLQRPHNLETAPNLPSFVERELDTIGTRPTLDSAS